MTDELRIGTDRRKAGRPEGGRRITDPIKHLATHTAPFVTPGQLADYWGVHQYTVHAYIRKGMLGANLIGGCYRIRIADALHFEKRDPSWLKRNELSTIRNK
jgi:hypothetical protein